MRWGTGACLLVQRAKDLLAAALGMSRICVLKGKRLDLFSACEWLDS